MERGATVFSGMRSRTWTGRKRSRRFDLAEISAYSPNSFLAYSELSIFSPNSTTRSRINR